MTHPTVPLGGLIRPSQPRRAGADLYPILSMTMHHGLVDQGRKFKKRVASQDTSAYKVVSRGQLVVGFPIDEGVLAIQRLYDEAIVSPAYEVWEISVPDEIDTRYLELYLQSPRALSYYRAKLRGSTARRRSLPRDVFLNLPVSLPASSIQREAVFLLEQVEDVRKRRRAAIDLFGDLHTSILMEVVQSLGIDALKPFGDVCNRIVVGVVVKPASHYVESGVPALRTLNIKPGRIDLTDIVHFSRQANDGVLAKSKLKEGDLVIARTGRPGTTAVVPPELSGANAIDIIIATPNADLADPLYLELLMNSRIGSKMVQGEKRGQIQQHFNVGSLRGAMVPIPPIETQRSMADRIRSSNAQLARQRAHLRELDALFKCLQDRAFAGTSSEY